MPEGRQRTKGIAAETVAAALINVRSAQGTVGGRVDKGKKSRLSCCRVRGLMSRCRGDRAGPAGKSATRNAAHSRWQKPLCAEFHQHHHCHNHRFCFSQRSVMEAFKKRASTTWGIPFQCFLIVGSTFGARATQSLGYWVCVSGTKGASTLPRSSVHGLICVKSST
jgi:hypothetical protein